MQLAQELERYREKLLDLSNRNNLINFRRSKNTIQFIDEQANQIYQRLVEKRSHFRFSHRQDSPQTKLLFKSPRKSNDANLLADISDSASSSPAFLDTDATEELTSIYEFSPASADQELELDQHKDDVLQTNVVDPDKLDSLLKSIAQRANTTIEETGVNYLHLVLGTLQWRESESSEKYHFAPLILIPVLLEKQFDQRAGKYVYKVYWTEDDIQHNLSLERKLQREFGLKLPMLDEELTPERYFSLVQEAIAKQPGWRVVREGFLGFFSFHKLLMYLDADPANWKDKPEQDLKIAERIMCGGDNDYAGTELYAKEYAIDENEVANGIPLVVDADSSQHSALCDIINGKNLVIEGPPGTGKSQTITNAIAAAINAGKSVLFVAEKRAALDVVENKLNALGLGEFCLAIHSDDASPAQVIASLRKRMEATYYNPRKIETERRTLEENKRYLNSYASLLQLTIGPAQETLYDLLWKVSLANEKGIPRLNDPSIIPQPTFEQFRQVRLELKTLQSMLKEFASPQLNPWWGFLADRLAPSQQDQVIAAIKSIQAAFEMIMHAVQETGEFTGFQPSEWLEWLRKDTTSSLNKVREIAASIKTNINWQPLVPDSNRRLAQKLIVELGTIKSLESMVQKITLETTDFSPEQAQQVENQVLHRLLPACAMYKIRELRKLRVWAQDLVEAISAVRSASEKLEVLGCSKARTLNEFKRNYEYLKLAEHPAMALTLDFHRDLFSPAGIRLFNQLKSQLVQVQQDAATVQQSFHQDAIPTADQILELEKKLRPYAQSWIPWLSSEFRQSKHELLKFAKPAIGKRVSDWLHALELLRTIEKRRAEFCNHREYCQLFGEWFAGDKTDLEQLKSKLQWIHTVKERGMSFEQAIQLLRGYSQIEPHRESIRRARLSLESSLQSTEKLTALGFAETDVNTLSLIEIANKATYLVDSIVAFEKQTSFIRLNDDETLEQLLLSLKSLRQYEHAKSALNDSKQWQSLGEWFSGEETDVDLLSNALSLYESIHQTIQPLPLAMLLGREANPIEITKRLLRVRNTCLQQLKSWREQRDILTKFGSLTPNWLNYETIFKDPTAIDDHLKRLLATATDLGRWSQFSRTVSFCQQNSLSGFVNLALQAQISSDLLEEIYCRTVYENAIERLAEQRPILRDFTRQRHDEVRQAFQTVDRSVIELNRMEICYRLSTRQPPIGNSKGRVGEYTEMSLIRHEINKQKKLCRIRSLMQRAGTSVQTLKPCFMMSPLSVAQYLAPESMSFDLVIMDEASQIKPEDALGAMLRARQIVVVGDPKQMPPTSFFDRHDEEVSDDEAMQMDNTESILEAASKTFQPIRRLRWHYRSKHEQLIQFSNDSFYEQDLVVFPSPSTDAGKLGVFLEYVPEGMFKNRQNEQEAARVVDAIIDHVGKYPSESLGVGTLNMNQARLIDDLLEKRCEADPVARQLLETFNDGHPHEKLFIKNLENLQGDERDVIMISLTYGRDPQSGKVANRFGPLTTAMGWRRFNVLITRARRRLLVFSSMKPTDILGGPDRSRGVNAMRDFISFCESKSIPDRGLDSGREPDSEFEESVGKVISSMGLNYVPQVGVAGFFIDIGVLSPGSYQDYILGIECDGATYHSSKSARDRDRLRQEIIESRGWQIHRIWSTDWYQNQAFEIERLRAILAKRLGSAPSVE